MDAELAGWLRSGRDLHDRGRYDDAIALYQRILQARPHEPYALYELAYSLHARRELTAAIPYVERVIHGGAGPLADAYILLGSIHDQLGDLSRGEQVFRAGLQQFPTDPKLYYNLGVNLLAQGQAEAATQELLANLTIRPDHARGWAVMGDARWATGHWAWALLAWARCLMLEPDPQCAALYAPRLWQRLFAGVDLETRTITLPPRAKVESPQDARRTTENMAVAVTAASRHTKRKAETDAAFFAHALETIVSILGELGAGEPPVPFWSPHVLVYFETARAAGHLPAVAYEIRTPLGDPVTAQWLAANTEARARCRDWSRHWKPAPR